MIQCEFSPHDITVSRMRLTLRCESRNNTLWCRLTADTGRLAPPDLDASTYPGGVEESTSEPHPIEPAGCRHLQVGTRRRQAARSSSSNATSQASTTTTLEASDSTAYPSAYSQESLPRLERHFTRQRIYDWLHTTDEARQTVLEGFRDRTQGHSAFNRLPRVWKLLEKLIFSRLWKLEILQMS